MATVPSNRPRMALSVPEELGKALADLSDATGKPAATLAVEYLVELAPQMHAMAKIFRYAQAGRQADAKRALQHLFGDALAEVMLAQQPDLFTSKQKPKGKARK